MTDLTSNPDGANQLRKNSLGTGAITFLVVSAAAPLTAVAGGVPLAMLLGNGTGMPATFLLVTAILLLFAVGYVAMARHIRNAGAFYAYTAQGFGGLAGGAAAMIAVLAYATMQVGLLGMLGAATAGFLASLGLDLPWWVYSLAFVLVVGVLGYRRVDLSARILTILVILEYLVVLIIDLAILGNGGDSGLSLKPFSTEAFLSGSPAIGLLFGFAAFIGFEATTIYSEEAREAHRTVPRATYLSVLLIGVFYVFTSWLMVNASGYDKLMPELQGLGDPTTFLFVTSERYVGAWLSPVMSILFITSVFAGVVAFQNGVARYLYVAGREGLLTPALGVTHKTFQSPHVASVAQTVIAFLVVGLFAVTGQDPVLALFSWMTNVGTLGIIVLMALTAFAIVAFFSRNPGLDPSALKTKVVPLLAGLILTGVVVTIVRNFGDLTGATGALAILLPGLVLIAGVVGFVLALKLKSANATAFDRLGIAQAD